MQRLRMGRLVISKIPTANAPTMDQKVENVWNCVDATWAEYVAQGKVADWSDFSGWAKYLYDGSTLYGLYYVQDDIINLDNTVADWQMQGVEFFIDAANTHTTDITVNQAGSVAAHYALLCPQDPDSVAAAFGKDIHYTWWEDTASSNHDGPVGYFVKFSVSLDSLGFVTPVEAGTIASFQLQLNDNDGGSGRNYVMNWNYSPSNTDWQTTELWGEAVFGADGAEVGENLTYKLLKTSTAPTIDGDMDAAYAGANPLTADYFPGGTPMANPQDCDWRFYGLYDANNLYGFYTVYDDLINLDNTIADWQMQGVEFFIDAANTHTTEVTVNQGGTSVAYHYALLCPQDPDSVAAAFGKGIEYAWKELPNIANDSLFSSRIGYTVEFKASLDSLGFVTPVELGTKASWQVQVNDNDGGSGRNHVTNWWYSPGNTDWQTTELWGDVIFGPSTVVGVEKQSRQIANSYRLGQNYPNPFNPSTNFEFQVSKAGFISVRVYDILGREVAMLVNEVKQPGTYYAKWNAAGFSSGLYFCKMQAGNFTETKKMILIK